MVPRRCLIASAALALGPALSGCAWLIGYDQLPQPPLAFQLRPNHVEVEQRGLKASFKCLGPGDRVPVARSLIGRVSRAANPYGVDTLVFEATLSNAGDEPAQVFPSRATLAYDAGEPRRALGMDDFRRRWPTWAVDGSDQEADRSAVMAYVLNTLLIDRRLGPGASTTGRLAFTMGKPTRALTLRLPLRDGELVGKLEVF